MTSSTDLGMRKRDIAYLLFFVTHIPIIFLIDTVPLLPTVLQTNLSHQLREFYMSTYQDKFFSEPPPWFTAFIWMELLYHVPASLLAVRALLRDHVNLPIHLVIFGLQAFITSLTCLVEVWSWTDRTTAQKQQITSLYGPYVALGGYMALDGINRLRKALRKSKRE
ncbi:unnamed protein product [Penicillium salamii]|uniref:Efficient mitochondria targeting-associated protein 19 n=1 Tax=Penicillium salamii TaxID=1612424 RepID=A0A9W4JWF4_9EURO|nr:unnamed protein product [Penicillium salamii]CAG8046664.1 unnamed protein product [Penicillium salamii]CAG8110046.1 unnamed protein product [Penicillium salamii]CAG8143121.1 unnamed protein product [Penicillium salamii]CAG8174462.1 unnamed protein product [Penicillium salamii]